MNPNLLPVRLRRLALLCLAAAFPFAATLAAEKNVLLIAGKPSHGPGFHEHNAGVLLLQKSLAGVPGLSTRIALNGWPAEASAFDGVDAVIIFSDGQHEDRHPVLANDNLSALDRVAARGAGVGLLHYAVEPAVVKGRPEFLRWIGGYFEVHRSVNPHWTASFDSLPSHPITRGVAPFSIRDEWYFYMRFVDGMKGITPLLVDIPPPETMARPDGTHAGNPEVRRVVARREPQVLSWSYERADGGRGFGFTGAHYHQNWGNEDFRKLVLNAVLWLAKMEVPPGGVASVVTPADLQMNLDPKPAPKK